MSHKIAISLAVVAGMTLVSCKEPTAPPPSSNPPPVRLPPLSPLKSCPGGLTAPTTVFKIYLDKDLNVRKLVRSGVVNGAHKDNVVTHAAGSADYEDASVKDVPLGYIDLNGDARHPATEWDMALGLTQPNQAVYIKVVTRDDRVTLRDDALAITTGDDAGQDMLCGPGASTGGDTLVHGSNYVLFEAYYDQANPVVSFNIGMFVKEGNPNQSTKFSIPVYLDPNVKNDG
jgi:hypothetical protein